MLKLVTLVVSLALAAASMQTRWVIFKQKYRKHYEGDEDVVRRYIWQYNLQLIENHNKLYAAGKSTFYMAENNFTDMNSVEFNKLMNGIRVSKTRIVKPSFSVDIQDLPTTVDWRTKGYVTPVKNQGPCGSCWAFSATGALEAQHFKATGKLVSLSESNLLDCSKEWGNYGCSGGLMDNAFQYIIDNGGIDTEAGYPYYPQQSSCFFLEKDIGATMSDYKDIPQSENNVQQVVATIGPVSIAIDASYPSFQHYGGGVYNEPQCSSEKLDHGVLIVGYGTLNGTDYWLVKNSWGGEWGDKGYIMMSRNKNNQCGIATMASYPIV